jgi:hypothetical protein
MHSPYFFWTHAAHFRWSDSHPDQQILRPFHSFEPKLGIVRASPVRASPAVISMLSSDLRNYFSHPSFSYLVLFWFATPPMKTTQTPTLQIHGWRRLLIANHLDQWRIRNTEQAVKSYLLPLFSARGAFTSHYKRSTYVSIAKFKPFHKPNQHILTSLHPILLLRITQTLHVR